MPVLPLQPVRDHFERPLVEQGKQPVGGTACERRFLGAARFAQLGRIDPDDADLAVAQLERVTIDHAGDARGQGRIE